MAMRDTNNSQTYTRLPVYNRGTRVCHWVNAVCVIGLAVIGTVMTLGRHLALADELRAALTGAHLWIGLVFAANLAWRIARGKIPAIRHDLPGRLAILGMYTILALQALGGECRHGEAIISAMVNGSRYMPAKTKETDRET